MRRLVVWRARLGPALLLVALLAACASSPKPPPEPRLRLQAQEAEASGARRYAQGEYLAAAQHFSEALRLRLSLDDVPAAARNRLQLAQTRLALGQAQQALDEAAQVREEGLQLAAGLLQVQARLALGQGDRARQQLVPLEAACPVACPEHGRVLLLQARAAWAVGDVAQTVRLCTAAQPRLRERGEEREVANAWRLLAAAQLQAGNAAAALSAAQAALAIDRQLALPEKIARDWLLIGDIQRRSGGKPSDADARAAYLRARAVAQAARLNDLTQLAEQALQETSR